MGFLSMNRNMVSSSIFRSKLKPLFCRAIATAPPPNAQQQPNNSKLMFLVENRYKETTNYSVICEKNLWRSDFPYRPFSESGYAIAGSCNGLYLVTDYGPGMSLWNPKTNDLKTLPRTQLVRCPRYLFDNLPAATIQFHYLDTYGFGFDSASNDYKAIRFLQNMNGYICNLFLVELYSLNSNSWKQITYPYPNCYPKGECVNINGVCYWETDGFILSFDLGKEKFSSPPAHIPLPPREGLGTWNTKLVEFDGSLAVIAHKEGRSVFSVWVWNGKAWRREMPRIRIDHVSDEFTVVGLFQKHKLFLQGKGSALYLFDCEKRMLDNLGTIHAGPSHFCVYPYVESYFPLNGN